MHAFKATSPSPLLPSLSPSCRSSHWPPGCSPRWVLQQLHADFLSSLGSPHRLRSQIMSSANITPFPAVTSYRANFLSVCFSVMNWTRVHCGLPQTGKVSACNVGDPGSIPGPGRSPAEEMATHSGILPGKSHGWGSLVGYSPWGLKDSDFRFHRGKPISKDLGHPAEAPFLGFGLGDELPVE